MAVDQGNPPPNGGQGSDPPQGVSVEEMNRAITARMRDLERKFEKQINDLPNTLSSKIEELLSKKETPPADPGQNKPSNQVPNPLDHPEVRGMKRQLQELEDQAKQLKAERDAEYARNRDSQLRSRLQEELTSSGIEPKRLRHAVGLLVDAEKRVRWDESGESILFYDSDGVTNYDLASGVKVWIKSEDGKLFLPPRGTSGTGGRPPGGKTSNNAVNVDRSAAANALMNAVLGGEFQLRDD